jgi:hypothetical protein
LEKTVLLKPITERFAPNQEATIARLLHVLEHGAAEGTGNARGVLFCDEMGLGKTICAICTANARGAQRILLPPTQPKPASPPIHLSHLLDFIARNDVSPVLVAFQEAVAPRSIAHRALTGG